MVYAMSVEIQLRSVLIEIELVPVLIERNGSAEMKKKKIIGKPSIDNRFAGDSRASSIKHPNLALPVSEGNVLAIFSPNSIEIIVTQGWSARRLAAACKRYCVDGHV